MSQAEEQTAGQACCPGLSRWTERAAFLLGCLAVAGSLYLTLGAKLTACPLCLYQRLFAMSVVAVLLSGWLFVRPAGSGLSVLALPLSAGGLVVALFHAAKEWQQAMVCPLGLFNLGTAPQQSLVVFGLTTLFLFISVLSGAARGIWLTRGVPAVVVLILIGALMACGMIFTGPPPAGGDSLQNLLAKQTKNQLSVCTPVKQQPSPQPSQPTRDLPQLFGED